MRVIVYGAKGVMGKKMINLIESDPSIMAIAKVDPFSEEYLASL